MMKLGPEKTGKFQGFGFGMKPGSGGAAAKPAAARRPVAGGGGVASLFQDAMEESGNSASSSKPTFGRLTPEALQAQRQAEELMAQDPSIFQYDEVIDEVKADRDQDAVPQAVRTDVLEQKKRVGLTVRAGSDEVRAGQKRQAKYIEKVMVATDRRKVEQQVIEDRLLKKEKEARKDSEVFVTAAFKEELKKRQKFVEELEEQEARDNLNAAEKKSNGLGFADMYRNLLNGGLASSRGGERLKERAPARAELSKEEQEELKKEAPVMKVEAPKDEEEKEEKDSGVASAGFGVQDVAAPEAQDAASVEKSASEQKEQRVEKAMSARERFLARKAAAAAAGGEG
mmetsp:Transcript_106324/g.307737  ORF Transcript_106324/g.307737 Transcript_106324/m.307737 type:complete len:342 (-) Transcript_106324:9-1034(-)